LESYPTNKQLTAWSRWLNGGPKDANSVDWRDALNMTNMLLTVFNQYAEV